MTPRPHIKRQSGFTLIEIAIVVVIVGIIISIISTVLPSLIASSKVKKARAILERADYTLQGYITANGRCPCPDTDGDGDENRIEGTNPPVDDTCTNYVGDLPFATLGLSSGDDIWQNPIRYGVYEDMIRTTTTTLCASTPCSPCLVDAISTPDTSWLRTNDGTTTTNVAYILVSGGAKDMDSDGSFFDGRNADTDTEFESPDQIIGASYDDLIDSAALTYIQGRLCTGSLGDTDSTSGAENTYTDGCTNSTDDDGDGYIDCLDQDCFDDDSCAGGANVAITTTSLPDGTVDDSYSATIQASGGTTPYIWELAGDGGFDGLFLHTYTGQLSGSLDQCPGTYTISIDVTDSSDPTTSDSASLDITVTADLSVSRTSGSGTDVEWTSATQEETFAANGGHVGDIQWSLNTGGADGFTVSSTDDETCTVKKNGETTTGTGPYTFVLTATDEDCSSNTAQLTFTVTIPATGTGAAAPYSVDMEAEWRFDECTDWDGVSYDVEDSLGDTLHFGRRIGDVTGVHNGKLCRAASFTGSDRIVSDELTGSDVMGFGSEVTLACWFKSPGGGGSYPRLIEFSDTDGSSTKSTAIAYDNDGSLRAWVSSQGGVRGGQVDYSAVTYDDNQWHHVVYTYSSTNGGRLYVDNQLKDTGTNHLTNNIHDARTFVIGGYYPNASNGFVGLIDEAAVFSRELTADEVDQLYNVSRTSCPGSCYTAAVAEYQMENAPWAGVADEVLDTGSGGSNGVAALYGTGTLPAQTDIDGGKICRAGVFDGIGGYLDMGDPSDGDLDPGTEAWTVTAWVYWDGSSGENIIYNKEGLYEARVYGGYVRYAWRPHWVWDGGSSFPVTANTWTHVATVYDGSEQVLYKNGERVYSRTQTGAIGSNGSKLLIGARGSTSPRNFFGGMIDEVNIYDRALSQSEIVNLVDETRSCP